MTVLDDVRALEQQVEGRLRELEPLVREYEQLRLAARRLGLERVTGVERAPAAARPGRDADRQPARPVLNTPERAKRRTSTRGARTARSSATGGRRPSSGTSGSPSAGAEGASDRAPRVGRRDDVVFRVVADRPGITVRELAERLGVTPAGLYRVVKRLIDAGRLRKDGARLRPPTPASASDVPSSARPPAAPDSPAAGPSGGPEGVAAPANAQPGEPVGGIPAPTYVYGVVPADAALKALDDERLPEVWALEFRDLAALVSDTRPDGEATTSEAEVAHWQVLAAAAEDTAVVPLRSGVVFASDDAVGDQLLRPRRAELTDLLEQFPRLLDKTGPAYDDDHAELRAILPSQPDIERLRETIRKRSQPPSDDVPVTPDERPDEGA